MMMATAHTIVVAIPRSSHGLTPTVVTICEEGEGSPGGPGVEEQEEENETIYSAKHSATAAATIRIHSKITITIEV
jgi:hypothetical protein